MKLFKGALIILLMQTMGVFCYGQDTRQLYDRAFVEIKQMLDGSITTDFKRAVFITENAYLGGELSYTNYKVSIEQAANRIESFAEDHGYDKYKTGKHFSLFRFMTESCIENENLPYTYDFNDFMGKDDWSNMFVTKLMKTHKGNCHSLPYFYKILADELEIEVSLALGPNHVYVKHIGENGDWVNLELTNGHPSTDAWIISSMDISIEAIRSGAYMKPLTAKESIALCLWDLSTGYIEQYGYDTFVLKCQHEIQKHFPNLIASLLVEKDYYVVKMQDGARNGEAREKLMEQKAVVDQLIEKIYRLGYKELPDDAYAIWQQEAQEQLNKQKTD